MLGNAVTQNGRPGQVRSGPLYATGMTVGTALPLEPCAPPVPVAAPPTSRHCRGAAFLLLLALCPANLRSQRCA